MQLKQQVASWLLCLNSISLAIHLLAPSAQASYLSAAAAGSNYQQQQQDPLAPTITPFAFNQNVQESQRVMVMCTTSSGEIPVAFSWLKDGQPLTQALAQARKITIKPDQDASTLKMASVRLEHAGNYTCLARNRLGSQAHSAQLLVHGEPRWAREPQHEPIVATRGQTVVIDCQTVGWPKPQQSWQIKSKYPRPAGLEPQASLLLVGAPKLAEPDHGDGPLRYDNAQLPLHANRWLVTCAC